MSPVRSPRAGFTLIEVLATVAIAALILMATYGAVSSTITMQKRTGEVIDLRKEGTAILDLVSEDLACAVHREGKGECFEVDDEGDPMPFGFLSCAWNPESGKRTLGEVGYSWERRDTALVMYRRFGKVEDSVLKGGNEILVSDEIHVWKTEFFDGEEWNNAWEETKSLPVAVKIEFSLNTPWEGDPLVFARQVAIVSSDLLDPIDLPKEVEP